MVTIQARWALAALTGCTTWPRTLRVRRDTRAKLCRDMGWQCLWGLARLGADMLFTRCINDTPALAHAATTEAYEGSAAGG